MQSDLDARNARFWDELCGSNLAQALGITDRGPRGLEAFDAAYMKLYPYLLRYVDQEELDGAPVLEIGIGYGTLGQVIASRRCTYHGLDIAAGPVDMMRQRLEMLGETPGDRVLQGSALDIPFADGTFRFVYSIGCLHHTGDTARAVGEVHRVLAPGGKAIVMLYNKNSFRQLVQMPLSRLRECLRNGTDPARDDAARRARYDANAKGEAAPHVDFVSQRDVRRIFAKFSNVRIDVQNFDNYSFLRGRILVRRESLLNNVARVLGTDLYIVATK